MPTVNYTALVASQCKNQNRFYIPQIGSQNYNVSANALLNATGLNRTAIQQICPLKPPGGVYTETLDAYANRITTIIIDLCQYLGILPPTTIPPTQAPTSTIKTTTAIQLAPSTTPFARDGGEMDASGGGNSVAVFMFSPAGIAILLAVLTILAVGVAIAIKHARARRRATIPLPPAPPPTADEVARAFLAITDFTPRDPDSESTESNYVELDRVSRRSLPLYDAATMNLEGEKEKESYYDLATA